MPRLIELPDPQAAPPVLRVRVGDVIVVAATGGHVLEGSAAIELVGAFLPGVPTQAGEVVEPAGPPSRVVLRARRPGRAEVELKGGDPYGGAVARARLTIEVQP